MDRSNEIQVLYHRFLEAWNWRNARAMADLFADRGELIGYDGSLEIGRENVFFCTSTPSLKIIQPQDSPAKSKMCDCWVEISSYYVPSPAWCLPGQSDINPKVNTHHTLATEKNGEKWQIQLFQNTPAEFDGRPELVEQMTEELRQLLKWIRRDKAWSTIRHSYQ